MVEPVRQSGVDIDQFALRIDREEAARGVIEILDRVLQFLEYVFLALAVAGDIGDRPYGRFRLALVQAERADPHPQPASGRTGGGGDADLFLLALALAGRLEQPEHCLGDVGIADEHPLDRAGILHIRRPRQRQIGRIGIGDLTADIGHRDAVEGVVGHRAHHRIVRRAVGEPHDAGGKGEQREQPDHRQKRQEAENIGLRLGAAERHEGHGGSDDRRRDHQHQHDAAAAPLGLRGRRDLAVVVGFDGHRTVCRLFSTVAARVRASPECPKPAVLGKRIRAMAPAKPSSTAALHPLLPEAEVGFASEASTSG